MTLAALEKKRLKRLSRYEHHAKSMGYKIIAGVDEAGRGPLAGPVVAAACILPPEYLLEGVNDSKQLTPKQRDSLFEHLIHDSTVLYAVGIVEPQVIDEINIYQATIKAMLIAIDGLAKTPDYILVDGMKLPSRMPSEKIIKGDQLSISIAAASIIAKVTRDRIMEEIHEKWPQYGFKRHKGYPTAAHIEALEKHGPCPSHRMSYEPVRAVACSTPV